MKGKNRFWPAVAIAAAAFMLAALLASCASSGDANSSSGYEGGYYYGTDESVKEGGADTSGESGGGLISDVSQAASRKIIQTYYITAETREFDSAVARLLDLVEQAGGYVQSSSVDGSSLYDRGYKLRSASFVFRIPCEKAEDFVSSVSTFVNVRNSSSSTQEITDQYYDTQARLESLKLQEERLLAILEKAESLSDVIQLESSLADVRYNIELLTGTLRKYESLMQYSTINITVNEVVVETVESSAPKNFWQRLWQSFTGSVNGLVTFGANFAVFLAGAAPVMAVLAVIALVVVLIVKRVSKKRGAVGK